MDENFSNVGMSTSAAASYDVGLRAHMQKVFNYMGGGLALTGILAWLVAATGMAQAIFFSPVRFLVIFAPLVIVLVMQFKMQSLSVSSLRALFLTYCASIGLSLSILFLAYSDASIARAFFITAGTFGAMSLYGYTTKRDLTGMGAFMMMGLFGLIIASVINLFLMSPMMAWITSILSIAIFTGLTAYNTQWIKEAYRASWGQDANDRLAVAGALRLYMDFINIFLNLLRLMGDRR